jgi:alkylhydroperoxidase family enzyme
MFTVPANAARLGEVCLHLFVRKENGPRIDIEKKAPPAGALQAMLELNGCAYCIDMHSKDARAEGETEQRLYELNACRETPFFTDRERAALEWTEAVTLASETHVSDDVYQRVRKHFDETELMNLTLAVVAINGWNRLAISFRAVPGTYQRQPAMAAR